ncbi:retrotransposon protein, putative, ty1-copia subclass [Tanacetum coccineum]
MTLVPAPNAPIEELEAWNAQYDRYNEVAFGVERFDLVQTFHACKQKERQSDSSYVLKMKLSRTVGTPWLCGKIQKPNKKPQAAKVKGKEVGDWERNCLVYLVELMKKKKQAGSASTSDDESFDQCISCISGKMTKKPFLHQMERATDLLGLIHTDVYGSLRHVSRQGASYFITSIDDFSRYGFVTRILNIVPIKNVDKTVSNMSYLEVWGYDALVKRDMLDKLQQRYVKCIFVGYPKEIMSYYFYFPPENKIVVARYVEFIENNLITQVSSGRAVELEEIQEEDSPPSKNTSKHHVEAESLEPQIDVAPVFRSERTHRAPDRSCLNVEVEEHSLGDLNEPTNYEAAFLDHESDKWLNAMNAKMSKWLFKEKTDLDCNVHTYKACLVAYDYTQTYVIDYEETFSPVADIRVIRILIAIAVFYDYDIWQMDVKTCDNPQFQVSLDLLIVEEVEVVGLEVVVL